MSDRMKLILKILIIGLLGAPGCLSQVLPDAPSRSQWIALSSATAAITSVDALETVSGYREVESPWLYGTWPYRHPARVAGIMGVQVASASLASWYLQRSRFHRFWWAPCVVMIVAHAWGVTHNLRISVR